MSDALILSLLPALLPHDFAVEGTFDPRNNLDHGYLPTGVGWYRKTFYLPEEDLGRRLSLVFDGVFRNCTVWVNGHILRTHPSGYIGCRYDFSDIAVCGGTNVVAVRVDATEFEGWWYEGAGIYRHVWLEKTGPLCVAPDGVFVHADVQESGPAAVTVEITLQNCLAEDRPCQVRSVILDAEGQEVARAEAAAIASATEATTLVQQILLAEPHRWDVDPEEVEDIYHDYQRVMDTLQMDEEDRRMIMGGTAERLFGL